MVLVMKNIPAILFCVIFLQQQQAMENEKFSHFVPGDNFESIHFFICFETAISEL